MDFPHRPSIRGKKMKNSFINWWNTSHSPSMETHQKALSLSALEKWQGGYLPLNVHLLLLISINNEPSWKSLGKNTHQYLISQKNAASHWEIVNLRTRSLSLIKFNFHERLSKATLPKKRVIWILYSPFFSVSQPKNWQGNGKLTRKNLNRHFFPTIYFCDLWTFFLIAFERYLQEKICNRILGMNLKRQNSEILNFIHKQFISSARWFRS